MVEVPEFERRGAVGLGYAATALIGKVATVDDHGRALKRRNGDTALALGSRERRFLPRPNRFRERPVGGLGVKNAGARRDRFVKPLNLGWRAWFEQR